MIDATQVQIVAVAAATETVTIDLRGYLERRREALLLEVRAIEAMLEMEPKQVALCPTCRRKWNKRAG